ncbi:hypothetical protein CPB85DRAFT_1437021 [Mucidula mucida]|nr:hypothetical protein CPB85DRAFT_1437021 [Mucidula mucida]
MQNVVLSDTFGTHEIISLEDEVTIIKSLFKGLNRRLYRSGSRDHDFSWLTTDIISKVLRTTFEDRVDACSGIANLLFYLLHSNIHAASLTILYTGLLEQGWLEGLTGSLAYGWTYNGDDCPEVRPTNRWSVMKTGHLAALYVDGLTVLASHDPGVFHRVLNDLSRPAHLSTLCKALLLSDIQTQARLWELARIVQVDHWDRRTEELILFAKSQQAEEMYNEHLSFVYSGIGGLPANSLLHGSSHYVAVTFAKDVARRWYVPPNYDGPACPPRAFHDFHADFAEWYQHKGVVEGEFRVAV